MMKPILLVFVVSLLVSSAAGQAAGQGPQGSFGNSSDAVSGCDLQAITEYNMGLHIGGVFIVFIISCLGILSAIVLGSIKRLRNNNYIVGGLQLLKFFGCGVVVATAWVHMLADAFSQFLNPCLQGYTFVNWGANFPGWIALFSALIVQIIEYFAMSKQYAIIDQRGETTPNSEMKVVTNDPNNHNVSLEEAVGHSHALVHDEYEAAALTVGTVMLELGIIFHSVIIGLTLGIVTDEWHTLIVAICFHQLFEGMALGSRIAATHFSFLTKLGMGLAYPITTPIGIAIGISVRFTYNSNSQTAILVQGIFDSISAGILVYNGYVELVAVEMNHNRNFHKHSNTWKLYLYVAFTLGLASMSIVGLWA
ncbi:Zinc/iron permease [Endogone sp. FLAS-F59071]|nr:Zinc/iron permease [Endogone sp. FLAS-F59071]|eukprot:RUS15165.1 Zinc/iron permease [Endogone sp. FLAS-F59071]